MLYVGPPDQKGRADILKIRMAKMSIESDVDVEEIARLVNKIHTVPIFPA
jgi:AAA family ATPase